MNKKLLRSVVLITLLVAAHQYRGQLLAYHGLQDSGGQRVNKILYFNPEVYPALPEIVEPTNTAFFSAVSNRLSGSMSNKMIRADNPMEYDSVDAQTVRDFCKNNGADFAIVPKVKYFKVGLGQYVFSNQVEISMKLYDAEGHFISESSYNTYRRNMRMLGSAENSIKIGTNGAIRDMIKNLRKAKRKS